MGYSTHSFQEQQKRLLFGVEKLSYNFSFQRLLWSIPDEPRKICKNLKTKENEKIESLSVKNYISTQIKYRTNF